MPDCPDQPAIDALVRRLRPAPGGNGHHKPAPAILSDEQVIEKCRRARNATKFVDLFDTGDISSYGSHSEADQALVSILTFYSQDPNQLDRLFRQSALMRQKWERADYRQRTINLALGDLAETYQQRHGDSFTHMPAAGGASFKETNEDENPLLQYRVPLGKVLRGGIEPPKEHEPGLTLRGKVHQIFAASGTGKTMLVLYLVKQALKRGEKVLLLDDENGFRTTAERLELLGVDVDSLDEQLVYLSNPSLPLVSAEHYEALLDSCKPDLVVFDSWVDFLAGAGLDENDNTDVAEWSRRFTKSAKNREITTIVIDHVPHDGQRSRGASRKKDEVDVAWSVTVLKQFGRETVGEMLLTLQKDRDCTLPTTAKFVVGGDGERIIFERTESGVVDEPGADGRTPNQRKALEALQSFGGNGATSGEWKKVASLPRTSFYREKDTLCRLGLVSESQSRWYAAWDSPPAEESQNTLGLETLVNKPCSQESQRVPRRSHEDSGTAGKQESHQSQSLCNGTGGTTAQDGNARPVSFDLRTGESATVEELKARREGRYSEDFG